ncbi:type II toxin-antitoxin system RelE/ParE family toxin [Flavobacterium sp.]
MAERIIVWSSTAKKELKNLLEFFIFRNKSKTYSLKLHKKIQTEVSLLILQPTIGKKTNSVNVRGLFIENYYIFYEVNQSHIIILSIWDTRQNPEKLKL